MTKRLRGRIIVLLTVLVSYAFFVFPTFSHSSWSRTPTSHYQYLTAGFLAGHLNLSISPPEKLLSLSDPYDPQKNRGLRLQDASLYHGKYYLYFGVVPVFAFFMPMKLLTGLYPPESLCVWFFLSLGFLAAFSLLLSMKEKFFPAIPESYLLFAGLILGFTNDAPFLLTRPKYYEAAIAAAFCFMSLALLFLYRLFQQHFKVRDAFFFSLFLSLTVAARPHFALVCFFLIPAVTIWLLKCAPRMNRRSLLIAAVLPALIVGCLLGVYNYLRFDSIWEFGEHYQLSSIGAARGLFQIETLGRNLWNGLFYYLLQPFGFCATFPYVYLQHSDVTDFSKNYFLDPIAGVLFAAPFVALVLALPKMLLQLWQKKPELRQFICAVFLMLAVPIIIMAFLFTLLGAAERYETDFIPYLVLLAIMTLWFLEEFQLQPLWNRAARLFFIITATLSILIGVRLGLENWINWHSDLRLFIHQGSHIIEINLLYVLLAGLAAVLINLFRPNPGLLTETQGF